MKKTIESVDQLSIHLESSLRLLIRIKTIDMLELRRPQVSSKVLKLFLPFLAELLAVGSRWPSNSYAEVYLTDFGHWKKLEKYPFDKDSKILLCQFGTLFDSQQRHKSGLLRSSVLSRCLLSVWWYGRIN